MIALIGGNTQDLKSYLEGNGIHAAEYPAQKVPSLIALLISEQSITHIVVLPDAQKEWSLAHVLSAAKQLQRNGMMIFFQGHDAASPLIANAATKEDLLQLLTKQKKPDTKADSSGGKALPVKRPPELIRITPLQIPADGILFLGIIGSQARIGCTTQAIALWHYCRKLGFDPAIVSSKEQIADIAGVMRHKEVNGGYLIEGIPFVCDTALAYDCYILDVGSGSVQDILQASDYVLLIAGSKPWELQHTAAALRALQNVEVLVLLSFSSQKDANSLKPLFRDQRVAVLPWMPDIWNPAAPVLAMYDTLLRPVIEHLLNGNSRKNENEEEIQLLKGE